MVEVIRLIGSFAVLGMIVPLAGFVALYALRSPWRENELGIALMFQKVSLTALITVLIAGTWLPDGFDPIYYPVRTVIHIAILLLLSVDVFNLHRYQRGLRGSLIPFRRLMRDDEKRRRR